MIGLLLALGVTLGSGAPAGLGPRPAWGKAPADFKEHVDRAAKLYAAGDFEGSLKELHAAYAIRQVPILVLNIGQAYRKLGRSKEALAFYELYLRIESSPKPEIRTELEHFIAQTRAMLDAAERMKNIGTGTESGTFAQPGTGPEAQPGTGPAAQPGTGPAAQPGTGPTAQPGAGPVTQPGSTAQPDPATVAGGREPPQAPRSIEPEPLVLQPAPPRQPVDLGLRPGAAPASVDVARPRPIYKRWWFWGAVSVVVAGAVVAGAVVATLPQQPADPKGLVIMDQRF